MTLSAHLLGNNTDCIDFKNIARGYLLFLFKLSSVFHHYYISNLHIFLSLVQLLHLPLFQLDALLDRFLTLNQLIIEGRKKE